MRPEFDEVDQGILGESQRGRKHLDSLTSLPRTGDALLYPDGTMRRVAHSYHDALQPTMTYDASYYVSKGGHMEFSGSLDSAIPNDRFTLDGYELVRVWFFHHGHVGAHRGVHCDIEVRRWKYTPA